MGCKLFKMEHNTRCTNGAILQHHNMNASCVVRVQLHFFVPVRSCGLYQMWPGRHWSHDSNILTQAPVIQLTHLVSERLPPGINLPSLVILWYLTMSHFLLLTVRFLNLWLLDHSVPALSYICLDLWLWTVSIRFGYCWIMFRNPGFLPTIYLCFPPTTIWSPPWCSYSPFLNNRPHGPQQLAMDSIIHHYP